MTAAALVLARDADAAATSEATDLWDRIVGASPDDATRRTASAALDAIGQHVGEDTEVPDGVLEEAVWRVSRYLRWSGTLLGFHGRMGEDRPEGDPRSGGYSALRRSGSMALLAPWVTPTAGVI